jgi:hypothetical protein
MPNSIARQSKDAIWRQDRRESWAQTVRINWCAIQFHFSSQYHVIALIQIISLETRAISVAIQSILASKFCISGLQRTTCVIALVVRAATLTATQARVLDTCGVGGCKVHAWSPHPISDTGVGLEVWATLNQVPPL